MQRSIHQRDEAFLAHLAQVARAAGVLIMQARKAGIVATYKDDHSPVTHADEAANEHIVQALSRDFPHIPIVSEEATNAQPLTPNPFFWLVDPLDGTRGFIRGEDEFTVNIGLIEQQRPVAGVIYLPATGALYVASDQAGAFRSLHGEAWEPIHVRVPEGKKRSVIMSAYHASPDMDSALAGYEVTEKVRASSSLKFCYIAEGRADLYPRTGPTMEWDTAAGHAIVLAAGGQMTQLDGSAFLYGKQNYKNPGFIVSGAALAQNAAATR